MFVRISVFNKTTLFVAVLFCCVWYQQLRSKISLNIDYALEMRYSAAIYLHWKLALTTCSEVDRGQCGRIFGVESNQLSREKSWEPEG